MVGKLLIDVSSVCDCGTNHALELLHKAAGDPPSDRRDDESIWRRHENPLLTDTVEQFSDYGIGRMQLMHDELLEWLTNKVSPSMVFKAPHPALKSPKWAPEQFAAVKGYLDALPKGLYSVDDWLLAVEYLLQKNFPMDEFLSQAEWYAMKTSLMGPIQNQMAALTAANAGALAHMLPRTLPEALAGVPGLTLGQQAALQWAKTRVCDSVVSISQATRQKMRQLVVSHQEAVFTGSPEGSREGLQTKLFDAFSGLNRDWRRIAITEAGESQTQGFVAAQAVGTKVKRIEQYNGACAFCRKLDGVVMEVVSADAKNKDGETQVWVGKNNLGRSASPSKRVDGALVPRSAAERWWIPAGLAHPHCRGRWVALPGAQGPDKEFSAWVAKLHQQMLAG